MFLVCDSWVLVAPPTLAVTLWLKKHIFIISTSSLKPPADDASYYARRFPKPRPSKFVKIIVRLYLQAFC